MVRFIIEQSDKEIYTVHSGLAIVGQCLNRFTTLERRLKKVGKCKGISHSDIVRSYVGLLCIGKSDYEAITDRVGDEYFKKALGIKRVPYAETLRQRMDSYAKPFREVIEACAVEMIKRSRAPVSSLKTNHVPLDIDVFPMDNSDTKKEGVSRTYHNYDGYAPIAAYLGLEGWCLETEFRPGSQHSQKGFLPFLGRVLKKARKVTKRPLLVRLDGGHDSIETRVVLEEEEGVFYILKWNPRRENREEIARRVFCEGQEIGAREGKRIGILTVEEEQEYKGKRYSFSKVIRVTERTRDKRGQLYLAPKIEIEGWWTNLKLPEGEVIDIYKGHGLCEQFHSEFKSDLDIERLPSGKFATNALVMSLAVLSYNILRYIGLRGLLGEVSPVRHSAKRRRIKTVIQELIYIRCSTPIPAGVKR
jgi:hypothetical protein